MSRIRLFSLLISHLFLILFVKCEMTPENVVIGINCGGDYYKDPRGIIYEKVNNFIFF